MAGGGGGAGLNGTGGQAGSDKVDGNPGNPGSSPASGDGGGGGGGSGVTGGAGGAGGAAGNGSVAGSGGAGGSQSTATFINGVNTYQGGDGAAGTAGSGNGGGGGGGAGAYAYFEPITGASNFVSTRIGGNGGTGGAGSGTGGGGGGGAGGYGLITSTISSGPAAFPSSAVLTGGSGGNGGTAGGPGAVGGAGGSGGVALFLDTGSTLTNNGPITGGNGGLGGAANGGAGGLGGQGGVGIAGSGVTVINTNTIIGGTGGAGGLATNGGTAGLAGQNGAGIAGSNLSVTNTGAISGGNGGQGDAIDFTGGTNSLTLSNGGTTGTLNGGIGVAGTLSIDPGTATGTNVTLANQIHDYNGNAGTLNKTGVGTLTLTGANTYSGGTTISGGTLQLGSSSAAGTGAITFASLSGNATARLGLDVATQPTNATFGNTIANFGAGNEINLAGLTNSSVSYNSANTSITVTGTRSGGQVNETFLLTAPRTTSFAAVSDGNGGTIIRAAQPAPAPCYVTGTRIRVLRGLTIQDVPVEHLRVGDVTLTASGKPRPIRWIGTRSYPGVTAPRADRPVRIRAGALAENVPARDLLVSPDHCLWLDGLLVAAGHLVNGTSITRGEAVRDLTYWHIELDSHDMLLAENAPAESFLAAPGVRSGFDGAGTDNALPTATPYAERAEHGPELAALRERLILRAGLSIEPMRFGVVRAWMDRCDGRRVAGWAQDAEYPDAPVCLDIVVDGTVVAMTLAEEYRADIAAAGVGDGRHGFDLELDEPLSSGIPHVVEVRRSADGLRVCAMEVDAAGAWTALLAA